MASGHDYLDESAELGLRRVLLCTQWVLLLLFFIT